MTTYTQTVNTLSTVALDTMTKDLTNLINEGGEKMLKHMAAKGRIFMVNDAEKLKHPVAYGTGEATTYFQADTFAGVAGSLETAAQEHLKYAQFLLHAATKNINYPQAMPAGNLIPYVTNTMRANMMGILNEEENVFMRGENSGTGTEVIQGAITGDNGDGGTYQTSNLPASLAGVVNPYKGVEEDGDAVAGPDNYATFGGLDGNDHSHWNPLRVATTGGGNASKILEDLQTAILNASFSETERPDLFMTTQGIYEAFIDLLRAKSRINDGVIADLGTTSQIPFAGSMVDWSRYLDADKIWDFDWTEGSSSGDDRATEFPVIGINSNSLRLNTVAGGGVSEESLGFVQKVGSTQLHAQLTNLFDRVQWKRCWSVDGGRRSFVTIGGITDSASA